MDQCNAIALKSGRTLEQEHKIEKDEEELVDKESTEKEIIQTKKNNIYKPIIPFPQRL